MQVTDKNGNIFGPHGLQVNGSDGKPKTTGGGGATPLGYYGAWQDDLIQTAAASNTGYAMIYRVADITPSGISIVNNGSGNPTRITFANTGIYNIQFSSQFQNLANSPQDVTIWLRKNGTDVAGSSGVVGMEARKNPGDPYHTIVGWNYVLSVVAGEYYELVWSTTDHTNVEMHSYAAGSPPPSAASVILTVTQQSGIMAGTGMTALNGLSGAVQTISTGTTGTDFNVASSGTNHQFNIPTASATNRGALSSANWTTFNGKQDTLVSGTNIKTVNGNSLVGSGNVSIGPRLMGFSGILGTNTTSTTITICHSLLIPANTLNSNNILQLIFRMYRVSGNVGQLYGRIYFNTTNSLTGATLFNTIFTMNGAGTQFTGYVERNFSYNGTNLTSYSNAAFSDYTTGNIVNVAFNRTVDNYVIFTMQCQNIADVANINLFKVFAYV
jgi:hypothetical protein